jgi:alanine racemase
MHTHAGTADPAAAALVTEPLCEIDLGAIKHNLQSIRSLVGRSVAIMAVVKADAYGHGAVAVATHLEEMGVAHFAVATVSEGIELRQHGVRGRILVLMPLVPAALPAAIEHDLTVSLPSADSAALLSRIAASTGRLARAHLMVDTGLGRGGFAYGELVAALPDLAAGRVPGVEIDGIWGHFARTYPLPEARAVAEAFRDVAAAAQRFLRLPLVHMASSQAIAALPESHGTLVRPGLALYGYLPRPVDGVALKPAMRLTAPIVFVKRLAAGTSVTYEHAYTLQRPATIATVRIGYADGYEFHLSNAGEVMIGDRRYPVVGRIAMDQILVEVGDDPVAVGQRVVMFGRGGPSPVALAAAAGMIPYVLLTSCGRRVQKLYREARARTAPERLAERAACRV